MRINFYDTRLNEDYQTILIKEKAVNYKTDKITEAQHYVEMMNELLHLDEMAEEYCYMIALNTKCKVLGVFFLSKGTVNKSMLGTREVFSRALLIGAVYLIIIHNHPSGEVSPSREDLQVTKRLKEAGRLMEIPLLDHIIIAKDNFCSFYEKGYFERECI